MVGVFWGSYFLLGFGVGFLFVSFVLTFEEFGCFCVVGE